jgi:hypothetical protein
VLTGVQGSATRWSTAKASGVPGGGVPARQGLRQECTAAQDGGRNEAGVVAHREGGSGGGATHRGGTPVREGRHQWFVELLRRIRVLLDLPREKEGGW